MRSQFLIVTCLAAATAHADPYFPRGAVSTTHPVAAKAGESMLEQGGNAVDAAVAAAFALAVVKPMSCGLGGGGFALTYDAKTKKTRALDFRETAPAHASRDMFLRDGKPVAALSQDGALSVATPGAVLGYLELLDKHGKLKRETVLAPAIKAAREGFAVSPQYIDDVTERLSCLSASPDAVKIFLRPDEHGAPHAPKAGTVLKQPELARTLEQLAKGGPKPFYEGAIAKAIASTVHDAGGVLDEADLKGFKTREREPLLGSYRGHRIATMPPPSSGGLVVLQTLALLESYGPKGLASHDVGVVHRYIEALRRSFVDRARYLADPAFVKVPMEMLLSKEHLAAMEKSIDPKHATTSASLTPEELKAARAGTAHDAGLELGHTSHISAIDAEGNAVALTTTVNYTFGSCLVAKGTGVLLNDEMDDFSAQPGAPNVYGLISTEVNSVAPGKVPLSSMSPTLVFQKDRPDEVLLATGARGGSTIPTSVIQTISNVVDAKMTAVRALGYGRIHHQWMPDEVRLDHFTLDPNTRSSLEAMGHHFVESDGWGDAELVVVDPVTGVRNAASDPRDEGAPSGL
ncbi:MAG: gamma-glutamyltransferase [Myxococcaceae bacterium]